MHLSPFSPAARRSTAFAVLLALLGCLGVSHVRAAAGEDPFERGNRLYAAGKYAEAAAAYETLVARGDARPNLFYNLGDAYSRAGNRGRAILNYQRALLLEPTHAEAAANLAFVGGTRPAAHVFGVPGVDALSWLTAAAGWLAAVGVLVAVFQRRGRTVATALGGIGLLGFAAGVGTLWWMDGGIRNTSRALVVADAVPARYSPADNSRVMTNLSAGAEVRVLSAQGAWIYAAMADGTRAWVASDKVERLIPRR